MCACSFDNAILRSTAVTYAQRKSGNHIHDLADQRWWTYGYIGLPVGSQSLTVPVCFLQSTQNSGLIIRAFSFAEMESTTVRSQF
jgi:hypothetical protein